MRDHKKMTEDAHTQCHVSLAEPLICASVIARFDNFGRFEISLIERSVE